MPDNNHTFSYKISPIRKLQYNFSKKKKKIDSLAIGRKNQTLKVLF